MTGVIADGIAKTRTERRAAIERARRPRRDVATLTITVDTTAMQAAVNRLHEKLAAISATYAEFEAATAEAAAKIRAFATAANEADPRISRRSPKEAGDA